MAVDDQVKPVEIIEDGHVERRGNGALFLVTAHVKIRVIVPTVREAMNQPWICVKCKYDGLVAGEQRIEIAS